MKRTYQPSQARACPPSRFPCPHGNQGRSCHSSISAVAPLAARSSRPKADFWPDDGRWSPDANATLRRLTKRLAQFLRAARGNRAGRSAFGLQAIASSRGSARYRLHRDQKNRQFSPERNRIKRRLRAAVTACALMTFTPAMTMCWWARREAHRRILLTKLVADLDDVHRSRACTQNCPDKPNITTAAPATGTLETMNSDNRNVILSPSSSACSCCSAGNSSLPVPSSNSAQQPGGDRSSAAGRGRSSSPCPPFRS